MPTSDPFEGFAEEWRLHLTFEPLGVAPRDLLAPLSESEQHFLVSLSRDGTNVAPVRLIFLTPISTGATPSMRGVLWWVAGDAWVLEQGEGRLDSWAATYGYSPAEEGTSRLFAQAARQSAALAELLGDLGMRRLLALYEAEVAPSRTG